MTNTFEIDLGRDGYPDQKPPSAWIIWDGTTFRMEVECYREAWCELDKENTEMLFSILNKEGNDDIKSILRNHFMQSITFQNFQLLDELISICKEHNIKYSYNSWFSR